jgi:hypothetical protein
MKMLETNNLRPNWDDILNFKLPTEANKMLRIIGTQRGILGFSGDVEKQFISFRHDRVRDWLLANAISKTMQKDEISTSILAEPYFAEEIGASLNIENVTYDYIKKIKDLNPLALFYSFKGFSVAKTENHKIIIDSIKEWLSNEQVHCKSNESLRFECLYCLSNTDSTHVLEILNLFNDKIWSYYLAGFRNGDIWFCQK